MTEQRLYKIVVESWPTDDGKPWPRFIDAKDQGPWSNPIPDWAEPLIGDDLDGMEEFARHTGSAGGPWEPPDEVMGWVMPNPSAGPRGGRRYWHNKAAAEKWIADARKWGAKAHLVTSDPIAWPTDD